MQRIARVDGTGAPPVTLGEAPAVRDALAALRRLEQLQTEVESSVEVDERAVLEVIFGPRRALSDPASKSALAPYGIPLPVEELCGSASRAAAEASRIGYPVRISLASPDLRVWDHPDLRVDMVDNAARVRDTFRQLFATAQARLAADLALQPQLERRLLGVLVTATSEALALLRVHATPLPHGRVAMRVGFADPHGRAARDETISVLPAEAPVVERALRRLAGAALLFEARAAEGASGVDQIVDVLQRIAAFVNDRRQQVESVELRPLALLADGSVEVREACVVVSDWFEKNS
jgi:acetyltransferase